MTLALSPILMTVVQVEWQLLVAREHLTLQKEEQTLMLAVLG